MFSSVVVTTVCVGNSCLYLKYKIGIQQQFSVRFFNSFKCSENEWKWYITINYSVKTSYNKEVDHFLFLLVVLSFWQSYLTYCDREIDIEKDVFYVNYDLRLNIGTFSIYFEKMFNYEENDFT